MTPQLNRIFTRSLLGAVLVLFLLPFTTLTCGGAKLVTMNGVQLATGTTISTKEPLSARAKVETIKPEPLATVAILAALAGLGLAFIKGKGGRLGSAIAAAFCAITLLAMKMKVDQDTLKQGQGVVGVQWEFGFWMALVAALAGAVLAFIGLNAPGETNAER